MADDRWRMVHGNCIEAMREMQPASVDAIVTDPPYGLEFMGREWDSFKPADAKLRTRVDGRTNGAEKSTVTTPESYRAGPPFQAWCEQWAREALRVLKPGGHLLAFGGTRTYHRLTCAIEDAGFEIRDCIAWMHGSGMPKAWNFKTKYPADGWCRCGDAVRDGGCCSRCGLLSEEFRGFSTALKPSHEPIVVARKPLSGTVAGNVLEHGTGALNVDGCRIGHEDDLSRYDRSATSGYKNGGVYGDGAPILSPASQAGRWPANVVLDEEAAAVLDEQTGELTSGGGALNRNADKFRNTYGAFAGGDESADVLYGDSGGASRFFYCPKADGGERNAGLAVTSLFTPPGAPTRNDHPTVKPIALMRWLVRLVTPPGGLVLDPFAGSGTTGCAAALEGFDFLGVEQDAASVDIARARLAHWSSGGSEARARATPASEQHD